MDPSPLSAESILQAMADALPTHENGDTTSDMSSSAEALALFSHVCMQNTGFRLIGLDQDEKLESECARLAPRLPEKWNASVSSYSFVYAHTQSSMQFIVKIDRLGAKIEIRGLAIGAENINRVELTARDYVSPAALPLRITLNPDTGDEDRSDLVSKLQAVFINRSRIVDLASLLKINIIQRLIPSLQKPGYQEEDADDRAAREDADHAGRQGPARGPRMPDAQLPDPARPYPFDDPLAVPPRRNPRPVGDFPPPDFDDELEIFQPGRLQRPGTGARAPLGIGHDDLHPPGFGTHDPLRQSFVPGGGYGGMGGGMHPTFDDPLFRGPRGGGAGQGGGYGSQAPPGARWDPVGPGAGGPRFPGGQPDDDGFGSRGFQPGGNPFGGGGGGFGGGIL